MMNSDELTLQGQWNIEEPIRYHTLQDVKEKNRKNKTKNHENLNHSSAYKKNYMLLGYSHNNVFKEFERGKYSPRDKYMSAII